MPAGPIGSVWAAGSWADTAWEDGSWADLGGTPEPGEIYTIRLKYTAGFWYGYIDGFETPDQLMRGTRRFVNFRPVWDLRYKEPFPPAPEYSVTIEHTLLSDIHANFGRVLRVQFPEQE